MFSGVVESDREDVGEDEVHGVVGNFEEDGKGIGLG